MQALSIDNVKGFMAKLLKGNSFDHFQLKSAVVDSFARFEISTDQVVLWGDVRNYVFDIIKGGVAPKLVKIILCADVDTSGIENAGALFINIQFEGGKISLTTGMSQKNFSLDKAGDRAWDDAVLRFLDSADIKYSNEI